jgi:citrate lyase beta subunit
MTDTSMTKDALDRILVDLSTSNLLITERYPGDSPERQPVHTVYGGAHLFTAETVQKLGATALKTLRQYAPDPISFARAVALDEPLAERVYPRMVQKLTREPVEDFRIDFEDGFGNRPDDEEDRHAARTAGETATGLARRTLPSRIGIRIKPLSDELKTRSLRTLDLFLTCLLQRSGGSVPEGFVVTLPKITTPRQVSALAAACAALEAGYHLKAGELRIELMIETTQSVFDPDGSIALPGLIAAGGGRIVGAHFGTYDYTAACGITAAHQQMTHPSCDFAKHVMQVALAGTSVRLSDGATNVMPVGPHPVKDGEMPEEGRRRANEEAVHRAWRMHMADIRHSLVGGFYQGWDLHPAQLPTRYAAVYAFFLEGLQAASARLRNFVDKAAQATLVGSVFDDAATGQGLLNYFLRAINCGAIDESEAVALSGLTLEELRSRSFVAILDRRRGA